MKNFIFRIFMSVMCLTSILTAMSSNIFAAPVKLNRVVQIVNTKPGRAATGIFSQLSLDDPTLTGGDDDKKGDGKTDQNGAPQQDERVIVTTTTEVVQDEDCNCVQPPPPHGGFPKWALLGLAAVPLVFLIRHHHDDTPTPTPPSDTPPTPPTPTTPDTPVPPEPVPEPMTILLFGTGLAGIGIAARKRFGKKESQKE